MAKWPAVQKIVQSGAESWSPDSKINSPCRTGCWGDAWRQIKDSAPHDELCLFKIWDLKRVGVDSLPSESRRAVRAYLDSAFGGARQTMFLLVR